jgi:hypothetical protein
MDNERQFTKDGDSFVFDVQANYSNASLVRQKIWLNQKTYAPQQVEIYDSNNNALVVMSFNDFKFDVDFEKDSFDMQRNMTGGQIVLPTLGKQGGTSTEAGKAATGNGQAAAAPKASNNQEVSIIEPSYIPEGVSKPKLSETKVGENKAVLLKYTGTYNYTLIESRPTDKSVSLQEGMVIDLGHSFGVLTGDEKKTLYWMYGGTEFRLSSGDLPQEEMVKIAMAVQDQSSK